MIGRERTIRFLPIFLGYDKWLELSLAQLLEMNPAALGNEPALRNSAKRLFFQSNIRY